MFLRGVLFLGFMPIEFVRLVVEHDDWSTFTRDLDAWVNVASSVPISNRVKRSMLILNASSVGVAKTLINRVRGFRGVKVVDVIGRYNVRGKSITLLSTIRAFNGGVLETILGSNVYYYHELIANGVEYWSIVTGGADGLISELGSRFSVRLVRRINVNELTKSIGDPTLTRRELRVLKTAYELGYFNWPRRRNVGSIAETLGISKTTLMQELRSILRKLALRELRNDYPY